MSETSEWQLMSVTPPVGVPIELRVHPEYERLNPLVQQWRRVQPEPAAEPEPETAAAGVVTDARLDMCLERIGALETRLPPLKDLERRVSNISDALMCAAEANLKAHKAIGECIDNVLENLDEHINSRHDTVSAARGPGCTSIDAAGDDTTTWDIADAEEHRSEPAPDRHFTRKQLEEVRGIADKYRHERDELREQLTQAKNSARARAPQCVRDLLAVIHRDDGSYLAEHGLYAACRDAGTTITSMRETIDSFIDDNAYTLREDLARAKDSCIIAMRGAADAVAQRDRANARLDWLCEAIMAVKERATGQGYDADTHVIASGALALPTTRDAVAEAMKEEDQ
uniref:Uncharacterized protein n=1 Tax=viral metagenome TaxID=1070528 RepID=A0A6M3LBX9_9ZZZZ